ncbi:MAG: hypothetical protein KI792_12685 [Alphaproteobacteria bacterium]|nr:hypothetical protein [Alphaproteobacteria bacterium SS10]
MTEQIGPTELAFAPGYERPVPLDAAFGTPYARPDWSTYTVRAHLENEFVKIELPAAQITLENRTVFATPGTTEGPTTTHVIPVITLTPADTAAIKGSPAVLYVDVAAAGANPRLIMTAALIEQAAPETA